MARAGDPAAAREQLKVGYQLAQDNRCEEAIPHFTESLRLDVKAITLINLANCEEKVGRLADASGHWVDARSRAQSEGNGAIESEAVKRSKSLETRIPRLTISIAPGAPKEAVIARDGVELGAVSLGVALPVNVGVHSVVLKAPGFEDGTKEITVAEGESKSIQVGPGAPKTRVVAATEPARGQRPVSSTPAASSSKVPTVMTYAGFGVAAVGVVVGAVTGIVALGKASAVDDACPDRRCRDADSLNDVERGRLMGNISTVAFIASGVGAAVGVGGLLWGRKKSDDAPRVSLSIGPTGGGLRGTF